MLGILQAVSVALFAALVLGYVDDASAMQRFQRGQPGGAVLLVPFPRVGKRSADPPASRELETPDDKQDGNEKLSGEQNNNAETKEISEPEAMDMSKRLYYARVGKRFFYARVG